MTNRTNRRFHLRHRRDAIMRREPVVLLDIGSSKIVGMIVQFMPQSMTKNVTYGFRVLATAIRKSEGVQFGEVSQLINLQQDLMRLMQTLQRTAGINVNNAIVSFSGGKPFSYGTTGEVTVPEGEVTEDDIGRALLACDIPPLDMGREFLHMLPINFTLDDQTGLTDPRGLIGARLAADMHLLAVDSASVHAIEQAIRGIDLDLIGLTVSGFSTGLGVLTEDELKRGCVVIDFGAMVTSVSVYWANQLMFVRNVRMGGQHVTNDLAQAFSISLEQAEKLKVKYGGVEATAQDDRDLIDLSMDEQADGQRTITRSELIGVIRPRIEEIFEEIMYALAEAGLDGVANDRFVISGGASQIIGLDELAERYFRQRLRIGRPLKLSGASAQQESLSYAAVSGLTVYLASPKDELWDFADPTSSGSLLNLRSIWNWFRQNW